MRIGSNTHAHTHTRTHVRTHADVHDPVSVSRLLESDCRVRNQHQGVGPGGARSLAAHDTSPIGGRPLTSDSLLSSVAENYGASN